MKYKAKQLILGKVSYIVFRKINIKRMKKSQTTVLRIGSISYRRKPKRKTKHFSLFKDDSMKSVCA